MLPVAWHGRLTSYLAKRLCPRPPCQVAPSLPIDLAIALKIERLLMEALSPSLGKRMTQERLTPTPWADLPQVEPYRAALESAFGRCWRLPSPRGVRRFAPRLLAKVL